MISAAWLPTVVILALLAGAALGQYWRASWLRRNQARLRKEAKQILRAAERTGQGTIIDAELKAKSIVLSERRAFQSESDSLRGELLARERLLNQRLEYLSEREADLERRHAKLDQNSHELEALKADIVQKESQVLASLEQAACLTVEQAKLELLERMRAQAKSFSEREAKSILADARMGAERKAREILASAIERQSREIISERTVSILPLNNEELRGRIIGRDGRNIRTFEAVTGVDVLLDEIPNHIVLSSLSPERREAAKIAMVSLIGDGRIQPNRIEEFVEKAKKDVAQNYLVYGKEAAAMAGCYGMAEPVLAQLGQLKFRTSYGQSVLSHSIETASIAEIVGAELGLLPEECESLKRAALLHDIGKSLSESKKGPHAIIGAEFLRENGEKHEVVNAVAAHHTEVEDQSMLCPLLRAADALSGARPGARREDYEDYFSRLSKMEEVARGFYGVEKAYAFQAGRELHLLVSSAVIKESELPQLAEHVARAIEKEIPHFADVKIILIRETRAVSQAKWAPGEREAR